MGNGPDQGPPEAGQELNLADEMPSPRGYEIQLSRTEMERLSLGLTINRDGLSGTSEFSVRGPLHRAANLMVVCGVTVVSTASAVALCFLAGADGWLTLTVGVTTALLLFGGGLTYVSDRRPFRRLPTRP